uniref:Poly [ADP-ribose] polymerase n=1 Tax=Xiphophorus couchianus TaxID=32473 RepID=A0A3B5MQH2_9TELE
MRRTRGSRNKSQSTVENEEVPTKTVWQWKGDDGQWERYPDEVGSMLDSASSSGKTSVTLTLGAGKKYEVDLKKMVQINPTTKYKRKIRSQIVKTESLNEAGDVVAENGDSVQVKEEEEEEETAEQPAAKRRRGQSKSAAKTKEMPKEEIKTEEVVRTVVMKGKAPVDFECKAKLGKAHVYSEGNDVYDVMLNQLFKKMPSFVLFCVFWLFFVIERYLQSTHAPTHSDYTMKVLDIFSVDRGGESDNFLSHLHNRTLLWHGSRLSNWVGILSKGLRVAPPEAPVTGYMFGKGIYFADMSSKSANYCFANQSHHVGLLLLSEVALGDSNELLDADYEAHKLPAGKHSTKGLGVTGPDPKNAVTLNGATVPMGPGVKTGVSNSNGYSLLYNEFIVYNPAQTRMRYLLRIQFNYSSLW